MRSLQALVAAVLCWLAASNIALGLRSRAASWGLSSGPPGSASIHEEATYSVTRSLHAGFNNLVIYKQDVAQNSLESIVPDLAESLGWTATAKRSIQLRQRRQWHDRQAVPHQRRQMHVRNADGQVPSKVSQEPRKSWYDRLST